MATFDLGRVTPLYKGDYEAAASYELNDVVLYNGNLYWHVQATATVGILPTDTTVWKLAFADEGIRTEIRGYADNAQNSADSANASKSAAAQSASQASASASQAASSAQTATAKASEATVSAQTASTKASEASASAQSAASSAQTATDKTTLASQKAAAASDSAAIATAKASAAATSETNAATAAQTATAKASEAEQLAEFAYNHYESARQSAVSAQASKTGAVQAAANAQRYAEDSAAYLNSFPTDTAEGAIASFADGANNVPVKSLVVDIEPVQSGTGDPSPENIRPITGWTGANITRTGKNLIPDILNMLEQGVIEGSNGAERTATNRVRTTLIPFPYDRIIDAGYQLTIPSGYKVALRFWTSSMVYVTAPGVGFQTQLRPDYYYGKDIAYARFVYAKTDESDITPSQMANVGFQLELGSTATPYEPYTGKTIDIAFPTGAGTVYGGTLDVTNGVLTVTKGFIQSYNGEALPSAWISDRDVYAEGATPTTGAEVCYDLSVPVTYNLTPTEVKSLLGANNIWADTGDTDVTYRADTTMYIQRKIAEAISALS